MCNPKQSVAPVFGMIVAKIGISNDNEWAVLNKAILIDNTVLAANAFLTANAILAANCK